LVEAKRKTRKRANIILNIAIAPLASHGITEGGLEGGLEVDLVEEDTILEEGTVGGIMPHGPKPPFPLQKLNSYLFNPPNPLDNSNLTEYLRGNAY
jgi:hypothetical protein